MNLRRVAALSAAVVLLAGCGSAVLSGHGSAPSAPGSSGTSGPTGFPSSAGAPSSNAAPSSGSADGRVTSPDGDFSVVPPAGWHEDRAVATKNQLAEVYVGPTSEGFAANVNVVRESAGSLTLTAYLQQALTKLRSQLAVHDLTAPQPTTLDGEDALTYTFGDTQGGFDLQQAQVVALHAGSAYIVTYTAVSGQPYADSASAVGAIRESWQWT